MLGFNLKSRERPGATPLSFPKWTLPSGLQETVLQAQRVAGMALGAGLEEREGGSKTIRSL